MFLRNFLILARKYVLVIIFSIAFLFLIYYDNSADNGNMASLNNKKETTSTEDQNEIAEEEIHESPLSVEEFISKDASKTTNDLSFSSEKKQSVPEKAPLFKIPANEIPKRRLPHCVIIGFAKCSTRALFDSIRLHPSVVGHQSEVHFYDKDGIFSKGFDWYQQQMPLSYRSVNHFALKYSVLLL